MRLTRRAFRRLVQQAIQELPPQVLEVLDNAVILVQEWPTREQLQAAGFTSPYELLGLYEGVPRPERGSAPALLPDRITLFQRPLEAVCRSTQELLQQVKATLVHEVAHHLGWSDEELDRLGYGEGKPP